MFWKPILLMFWFFVVIVCLFFFQFSLSVFFSSLFKLKFLKMRKKRRSIQLKIHYQANYHFPQYQWANSKQSENIYLSIILLEGQELKTATKEKIFSQDFWNATLARKTCLCPDKSIKVKECGFSQLKARPVYTEVVKHIFFIYRHRPKEAMTVVL